MNVLFKTSYIFEGFLFSTEQNTIRYRMNTCKKKQYYNKNRANCLLFVFKQFERDNR